MNKRAATFEVACVQVDRSLEMPRVHGLPVVRHRGVAVFRAAGPLHVAVERIRRQAELEGGARVAKVTRLLVVVVGPLLVARHAVAASQAVRIVERRRRAAQLGGLGVGLRGALEIDLGRRPADGAVVGLEQPRFG